jgi:hypothetical protein
MMTKARLPPSRCNQPAAARRAVLSRKFMQSERRADPAREPAGRLAPSVDTAPAQLAVQAVLVVADHIGASLHILRHALSS